MKIKFNELPDGFEVRNGQVVESKQTGGTTGDQKNYGLVTGPQDEYHDDDIKVKYSMSAVPRDEANIEAEGGETVLADLNGDGSFGLYDIKGSRHANGGVPLYLPEQSFVFSDYNKMKLTKDEMAQMGVTSKKRLTPAKVSKKYGTNEYYAAIKDPFADDIQVKSAEMMLDKNKMQLSKLAFMQEAKKDFEEGVPVTSFPYLVNTGHDPIEYTQQVEQITRQQAEQKLFDSLNPQQQMQYMAMKEYMSQVDKQPQQQMQQQIPEQEMAQFGYEIDMPTEAQYGKEFIKPLQQLYESFVTDEYSVLNEIKGSPTKRKMEEIGFVPEIIKQMPFLIANKDVQDLLEAAMENLPLLEQMGISYDEYLNQIDKAVYDLTGTATDEEDFYYNPGEDEVIMTDPTSTQDDPNKTRIKTSSTTTTSGPTKPRTGGKRNIAYDDKIFDDFYRDRNISFTPVQIGARKYRDIQRQKDQYYGDATDNIEGFYESWEGVYPGFDALKKELEATKGKGKLEEVGKFQKWFNDEYIPFFAKDWANNYVERNYTDENGNINIDPEDVKRLRLGMQKSLQSDFGFNPNKYGRAFDKKMGTFTSSRRAFDLLLDPVPVEDYPLAQEEVPEKDEINVEPGEFTPQYGRNDPRFWLQDLIKINAVANRKRKKFYPWEPPVENVEVNWLLEDPTRAIAATNEQLNIMGESLGAFSGPQSLNARMANAQGKAAANVANVIAGVHNRNINTTNKGLALQTQYDSYLNAERRKRQKSLYDNTQLVEQNYMNEKNFDREQLAGLVANAYTNAANTYNLNSLNDYYSIDPSTGGIINFDRGKNMAATKDFDQNAYMNQYLKTYNKFIDETGDAPTTEIMEQLMKGYTPGQTNLDAARQQYYDTNPLNVDARKARGRYGKKGTEIKHKLLPFFIGAIGI